MQHYLSNLQILMKMIVNMRLMLCLLTALACIDATAQEIDTWSILEKTAYAARELNYEGTFEYQNGKQLRHVKIIHINNGSQEFARNIVLDHQTREVYTQDDNLVIVQPKDKKIAIEKRRGQMMFPAMLPANLDGIKAYYSAKLIGTELVASRDSQVIYLSSNDNFRYHYKIWADKEFGLLLKMALLNRTGETIEQIAFNQIGMLSSVDSNTIRKLQPKIDVTKKYVMEDNTITNSATNVSWEVKELPPGYKKIEHVVRMVPGKTYPIDQVVFSDGIASVSLFIEPLIKGMRPRTGHTHTGSTSMCASVINGHQVIVVGEVPEETVMQIAHAVSFKNSH